MEKLLCPSLLNLSDDYLKDEVQKLDRSGVDILHLDVMDGDYLQRRRAFPSQPLCPVDTKSTRRHDLFVGHAALCWFYYKKTKSACQCFCEKIDIERLIPAA